MTNDELWTSYNAKQALVGPGLIKWLMIRVFRLFRFVAVLMNFSKPVICIPGQVDRSFLKGLQNTSMP